MVVFATISSVCVCVNVRDRGNRGYNLLYFYRRIAWVRNVDFTNQVVFSLWMCVCVCRIRSKNSHGRLKAHICTEIVFAVGRC